jgi:hypothetical protein
MSGMRSLHSLIAFHIPWFQISPSALVIRHGLFQGQPVLLHAACSSSACNGSTDFARFVISFSHSASQH